MHWIIFNNIDNVSCNGINRFIQHIVSGLSASPEINIIVINIAQISSFEFTIESGNNVTFINVPIPRYYKHNSQDQKNIGKCILKLILRYIPLSDNIIVHINSMNQYFIVQEIVGKLKCKSILTLHNDYPFLRQDNHWFDDANLINGFINKIVTISDYLKAKLCEANISPENILVIPNCILTDNIKPDHVSNDIFTKYGIDNFDKIIIYNSLCDDTNGTELLAKVFNSTLAKRLNCRFVVIGNHNLEKLVTSTRSFTSSISFLGCIPYEDVISFYHKAYMGVFLSQKEYCNATALEMLQCGLPVVAFNIKGLDEIFEHNDCAFLIDPEEHGLNNNLNNAEDSFTESINRLLIEKELRNKFSNNAKSRAKKLFSADIMINRYLQISHELLNQKD